MSISTSSELQNAYNDLYMQLAEYIWDFDVVTKIAKLEVETYKIFIDINAAREAYSTLYSAVNLTIKIDDELKAAFDNYKKVLNNIVDRQFANVYQVSEVIDL